MLCAILFWYIRHCQFLQCMAFSSFSYPYLNFYSEGKLAIAIIIGIKANCANEKICVKNKIILRVVISKTRVCNWPELAARDAEQSRQYELTLYLPVNYLLHCSWSLAGFPICWSQSPTHQ